jgi:uncharacterized protein YbjT (DUF2867 family)
MKMLVIGGAGFIGSHNVDLFFELGYEVRILDPLQPRLHPRGKHAYVPVEAEFIKGDVANPEDLARAVAGMDFVFHLSSYQDYLPDFSNFIHTNTELPRSTCLKRNGLWQSKGFYSKGAKVRRDGLHGALSEGVGADSN